MNELHNSRRIKSLLRGFLYEVPLDSYCVVLVLACNAICSHLPS